MKLRTADSFHSLLTGFDSWDSDFGVNYFYQPAQHHYVFYPKPPVKQPTIEYRSIDGSGNNKADPSVNQTDTEFTRLGPAHFKNDDGHTPIETGPNPRTISNVVVGEGDADVGNPEGVSGMMYAWGQFIDHDLDLTESGSDPFNVTIPNGDPDFPDGSIVPLLRAAMAPGTGTAAHPATAINSITGWLDASMVYGSDAATAASLRLPDGHMKTSAGNNLPIDPQSGMYMAGDVRAQENPSLTSLQTLFVREHNYQVDELHKEHPTWTGEHLYQQARAIVTAEIAHITYSEFLVHLLGPKALAPYHGYDPTVDPTITEEFAGAAYRFGHSMVSAETEKLLENGAVAGVTQDLKDVFFEPPAAFAADTGADGILRHLGSDLSQAMDGRIVEDLRNFLSDPPDALDLAATNIQRGRDLGLGTLNQTRDALGLQKYTDFNQITDDAATAAALKTAFGDVDKVDLWTGGLSEKHVKGALLGETFETIVAMQFEALRDGDRLWYQNQGFDAKTLYEIEHTKLSDVILRNTDTKHIQDDMFSFMQRVSGAKGGITPEDPNAPMLVIGANGVDTLKGGAKNDILVAGTGKQVLTGGAGADEFHFVKGPTNATITDFKPGQDKLVFEGYSNLSGKNVYIGYDHGKVVVQVGNDHVELLGLHQNQFGSHDYLLQA